MPYRRRFIRRRRYFNNRARRYIKRKIQRRRFMNDGKRFFKIRVSQTIAADSGGVISLTYTDNPSVYQDWTSIAGLFDSYRTCAIKIKFIPELPNDTSTITGFKPLYIVHDSDSSTIASPSVDSYIQYENMQVKNMFKPWGYYRKFAKQTANPTGTVMLPGGYKNTASPNASQGIFMYGDGFDISTNYGRLVVTQYVVAKNRR